MIYAKCTESGDKGDMAMGPVADQFVRVEVMGGRDDDGMVSLFQQLFMNKGIQIQDQPVGFKIGQSPLPGGIGVFDVTGHRILSKGNKVGNHRLSIR